MSGGAILQTAGELVAAGITPDLLPCVLEARLRHQHDQHIVAVLAGEATLDLSRLAILVAADGIDHGDAEDMVLRDVDDAIFDAEHRLAHPRNGDDPHLLTREIARLQKVRDRRQIAWADVSRAVDYTLDATTTYTTVAPTEHLARPTATIEEAVAGVEGAIANAIEGRGPKHVLVNGTMGASKTYTSIRLVARQAAERREAHRRWIQDYRCEHPGASYADAVDAAEMIADMRPLRVLYVAETHELVGATVRLARETFGLRAEHHGGYERRFDPADPTSPPACTQPERVKQTQLAGESVPDKACGRSIGATGCPDRSGCRFWQRLSNCAHAELVGTTIDNALAPHMSRELTGFDVVIIDEALDRAGYGQSAVPLDYLSDRHFVAHPVRDTEGNPDIAATTEARADYKMIRDILDAAPNGYAPMDALRTAGFDAARLLRLVDLTDARDAPSGMTSTTPDDERREIAQRSFRHHVRTLCGLFRRLAEPGDGWVRLDGDERRVAIVRSVRTLHHSILAGRILALDGSPDLTSWQRFIPDIEVVSAPRPHAPHQTAVQIVRPSGKHAMRNRTRKRYSKAALALYAHGETGVLTHLEHEADFAAPGIITGHFGALTGRNDWKNTSTMLTFGLPFLSPEAAAYEGAGRTGEAVTPEMPVRTLRPVMMRGGGVTLVPSMEYTHPAAREAQAAVRERQAMQGPGGRPRAVLRTADNPVLSIYVGTGVVPGVEFDHVITSVEQFAPDRFVCMAATGLVVATGRDRHRLHPDIYLKQHSAEYDVPREVGGLIPTLQRVLYPVWWGDRPRTPWVELRYWVKGRGNRVPGRAAACPAGDVARATQRLHDACSAVRVEVVADVHRPAHEASMMPVSDDLTWVLGTSPRRADGPLFPNAETTWRTDHPPDG